METSKSKQRNYGFKNPAIIKLLHELDLIITILDKNIKYENLEDLVEPEVNMLDFEIIQDPDFENGEWDFTGKSLVSLSGGYSGRLLQVDSLKLTGSVTDGAEIIADDTVFCDNCFGSIEAQNVVANNIGTLKNIKKNKSRMNILAKRSLIVHGKSYFAFVDAWNAKFEGLVRSSTILLGRSGFFTEIGNGTQIEINPLKTNLFSSLPDQIKKYKDLYAQFKKEKDILYKDSADLRVTIDRTMGAKTDNIPPALRERMRISQQNYDQITARFNEYESFFVNRFLEDRLEKIEKMKKFSMSEAYDKSFILVKGKVEPYVTVTIKDKTIELDEPMQNVRIFLADDKIRVQQL